MSTKTGISCHYITVFIIDSGGSYHFDTFWCNHVMASSNGNIFRRYWHFVRGIHRSPVDSLHKGQWRGSLMFSLICAWSNIDQTPSRSLWRQLQERHQNDNINEPCSLPQTAVTCIWSESDVTIVSLLGRAFLCTWGLEGFIVLLSTATVALKVMLKSCRMDSGLREPSGR